MADDLGSQFIKWVLTTEVGIILLSFTLATVLKYFWRKKASVVIMNQFESKKYYVYIAFAGLGVSLWWVAGENVLVSYMGLAVTGASLSSFFIDAWTEHIKPFIELNTSKVMVFIAGLFLFMFNRTLAEALQNDILALIFAITGIALMCIPWVGTANRTYRKIQENPPPLIKNLKQRVTKSS